MFPSGNDNAYLVLACSSNLDSLSFVVSSPLEAAIAIDTAQRLPILRAFQLLVKGFRLAPEQLAFAGKMPYPHLNQYLSDMNHKSTVVLFYFVQYMR